MANGSTPSQLAIDAVGHLRRSPGYASLSTRERVSLDRDLDRIEAVLGQTDALAAGGHDPYWDLDRQELLAHAAATPADLHREVGGAPRGRNGQTQPQPIPTPSAPAATQAIGQRAADVLEAVDFTGFVSGLVTGTFQAIVQATREQIREYAELVADLSRTVEDFASDRVTDNQARDWLVERHPHELRLSLPEPGSRAAPRVLPRESAEGSSPDWLEQYGLAGQTLTEELTEGELLRASRRGLAETRMQSLATMVLLGINRVVVRDGHIRAKMQFHAVARDSRVAELQNLVAAEQGGIAGQHARSAGSSGTMVSTVKANAQADAAIRADLMGEVNIRFESETFPLERFADSAAIQLINRHARWQPEVRERPAPGNDQKGGN